ncbi:MAG: DUF3276 family protein [Chitinophagaceae bacterium]|nr:DUF3276 family protein [Chitinophagaceae bacterium]
MSYEKNESIFSKRLKAGKRRTYFFDVRTTKNNDYFITLTESKKRFEDEGYDRHKIFIYKEDFNKFRDALSETIDHVKTVLMPDFDFDAFNHDYPENENWNSNTSEIENNTSATSDAPAEIELPSTENNTSTSNDAEVDKW